MTEDKETSEGGGGAGRLLHLLRRIFLRWLVIKLALLAMAISVAYWGFVASDRYVSEGHLLVQKTDIGAASASTSAASGLSSLLGGGAGGGSNRQDQILLYDYLQTAEVFNELKGKLNLFDHYTQPRIDYFSRLWPREYSNELFHKYFKGLVTVTMDEYTGLVIIKAQAFDPKTAQAIVAMMIGLGEKYMNEIAHKLANEQVSFLEKQVQSMEARVMSARQELLRYQNSKNIVSPQATAETVMSIVSKIEGQVADLSTRRAALLGYLDPKSPSVVELDMQIAALEEQMRTQRGKLTSERGDTINAQVEEYQRLQMTADFSLETYKTALTALERGRNEAVRMLKKVTLIQAPTLPDYPLEPRRVYMGTVYVIVTLLIAGIAQLMVAIIKDHQD